MKIITKINNNAAIAVDAAGKELVVLGNGVGFPKVPYELDDLSKIRRTFYDVNPGYVELLSELPQSFLIASAEIVEEAEMELDCELNSNLPFTLADHLYFAAERYEKGIDIRTPLAYDIIHLYPKETGLGRKALLLLEKHANIKLPEEEAVNIALHLINAETENGDMHSMMQMIEIIASVDEIVEKSLRVNLDRESYYYSRFVMHLRYLVQRLSAGEQVDNKMEGMLPKMASEYPQIYECALSIAEYFRDSWKWICIEEEILYLMIHIVRLKKKVDCI